MGVCNRIWHGILLHLYSPCGPLGGSAFKGRLKLMAKKLGLKLSRLLSHPPERSTYLLGLMVIR